jgi:rubredoxin
MFDDYNDGLCPQCALQEKGIEMLLNSGDYWECPVCHIQAAGGGGRFMILRERGSGEFKSERVGATGHIVGAYVCAQSAEDPLASDGKYIDEAAFRAFLEHEVR